MVLYNGETTLPDKGRAMDACKYFDTVAHNRPLSKLERYIFVEWLVQWMRNCLDGHNQNVVTNSSMLRLLKGGIPRESVLGPMLFKIFINDMVVLSASSVSLQMTANYLLQLKCLRDWVEKRHFFSMRVVKK